MAVKINFNEASAQTHTALIRNERLMNKSLLRLSTGMRILNAADDSAGLFISDMLLTVAKAYDQGNRNIQTGISALQIAEVAAGNIYDKLQEIYVRAQNAANDINDPTARAALQQEIRNFVDAIQKIGTDTEYNGIRLLDGTFKDKYIHYGARMKQVVYLSVDSLKASDIGAYMVAGKGSVTSATGTFTGSSTTEVLVNISGRNVVASASSETGQYLVDFGILANNINKQLGDIGFQAKAVNVSIAKEYGAIAKIEGGSGTETANLTFYVGGTTVSITGVSVNITLDELVEKINRAAATAGADLQASTNAGRLVLKSENGYTIGLEVSVSLTNNVTINFDQLIEGAESRNSATAYAIKYGDFYLGNDRNYTVDLSSVTGAITFNIGSDTANEFKNLYSIDVTTNEGSEVGMMISQIALRKVDSVRAQIGATMNNLQSIFDSQKVAYDNTKEAESVIRNTDYAKEMAEFTTLQIRIQATIAMLAQANTLPQLVLQLLR